MNKNSLKLRDTYDKIAKDFDSTRVSVWPECRRFMNTILPYDYVLDVGFGSGINLISAFEKSKNCYGVDFSTGFYELVKAKEPRLKLSVGDVCSLPYDSLFFDKVMCVAVVHHLDSEDLRLRAISEIVRVLKKGGVGFISVWAHDQDKFRDGAQDVDVKWRGSEYRFYHLFLEGELENLISCFSVEIVESVFLDNNYFVYFRKV
jgi:tRNA (uracil-5-)-methyltransferase TRM9